MSAVDYYLCPECGEDVPVGSKGCSACKADEDKRKVKRKRSWESDSTYDGLGLPDEGFDYEDFIEREFGDKPHRRIGIAWYWWVTAVVLLVGMTWMLFT